MPVGIDKIIIKNFKAFPEEETINLNGKHLLVYGENGSGKSSIYWALYTLFQAKDKGKEKTEKYFNKAHPENLLNLFNQNDEAYIKISLTTEPDVFYVLDKNGVHIEGASTNTDDVIVGLNNSSDFISHRLLINFYNYRNSNEIDLWKVFERDVIPFLKTNRGKGKKTLNTLYNEIINNKPYYLQRNGNIKRKDVSAAYTEKIKTFNEDLKYWVLEINTDVNNFYKKHFQSDSESKLRIEIELNEKLRYEFVKQKRKVNNREAIFKSKDLKDILNPFIKLSVYIEKEKGLWESIDRPQSFLNEAKLTAIALSVRFVLLEPHIRPAFTGRILALDDLLISLDMSNRDIVTNLIFDKYLDSFQTIILTHNREYFIWAKHELENRELLNNGDWEILEMYVDELDSTQQNQFVKPIILKSENELAIALKHFKNHDYPASVNYLRKHSENILCSWIPEYCWRDKESRENSNNKMALRNIIENGINNFWASFKIDCTEYKELRKYVRVLLNPLSHADVGVERYKEEIKQVIKILEQIRDLHAKYKYQSIESGGNHIQLRQIKNGDTYIAEYELADSLYKLEDDAGNIKHSIFKGKMVTYKKEKADGTNEDGTFDGQKKSMQENHNDFISKNSLTGSTNWMEDLYKTDGTKIL